VKAMTGPGNPFTILAMPTVIGGVTFPAGTYSTQAFIQDLQVTNAKIGYAAIDDAKIASLSADKINAGFLSADRIQAGSIDAKIANLDTAVITSGYINAARINTASIANVAIGTAQIANATIRAAQITGTLIASQINGTNLSVVNGSFSGALYGANGTFSGSLTAQVVKAENIISRAATSFDQSSLLCPNDTWTSYSFYMDHYGIATVVSSGNWNQSGTGGSHSTYLAIGDTGFIVGATGSWYSSAPPGPSVLMLSRWLNAGWHTLYVKLQISTATSNHVGYITLLRSYR
jgi:hypothetical protein